MGKSTLNIIWLFAIMFVSSVGASCPNWKNATNYAPGAVVLHSGSNWKSKNDGNAYVKPGENAWFWVLTSELCFNSYPKSSSIEPSSSSQTSSSSIDISNFEWSGPEVSKPFNVEALSSWGGSQSTSSLRCGLNGKKDTSGLWECINPDSLNGKTLVVPGNVTRVEKDMFSLCQQVEIVADSIAIVYLLDRSKSMSWNDPDSLSAGALYEAVTLQNKLDSNSYSGYLSFHSTTPDSVSINKMTKGQLGLFQTAIKEDQNWETNHSYPIKYAREWLFQEKFKDFKKAIVFITDGEPSGNGDVLEDADAYMANFNESWYDTDLDGLDKRQRKAAIWKLIQEEEMPSIYGIFLGDTLPVKVDGNTYKTSPEKLEIALGYMEAIGEATGGGAIHIKTAEELKGVVEGLITSLVESKTPNTLSVGNIDLASISTADGDQGAIEVQVDSSRHISLPNAIPLKEGVNEMILNSEYIDNTFAGIRETKEVRFNVEVKGDYFTESGDLEGTPFTVSCEETNSIEVSLPNESKAVDYIPNKPDSIDIKLKSKLDLSDIDSMMIWVYSHEKKDYENLYVKPISSGGDESVFSIRIQSSWGQVDSLNGVLDMNWKDSVYIYWEHPYDQRDYAFGFEYAFKSPPDIDSVFYFDTNGDGRLDSIHAVFDEPLVEEMIEEIDYKINWLDKDGEEFVINLDPLAFNKEDLSYYSVSIEEKELDLVTYVKDGSGIVNQYEVPSYVKNYVLGSVSNHVDKMSPIIDSARILREDKYGNERDMIEVVFSEPIDVDNLPDESWLKFDLYGSGERSLNIGSDGSWEDNNSMYSVEFGRDILDGYIISPRDQIKFNYTTPKVVDLSNNKIDIENPYVTITGGYIESVASSGLTKIDADTIKEGEGITLTYWPSNSDMKSLIREKGLNGLSYGPIKIAETDTNSVEDLRWNYQISIYNNDGQFIIDKQGVINCTDEVFKDDNGDNCKTSRGKMLFFDWNSTDVNSRVVGTGVYLVRLIVNDKPQALEKIGIKRK